MEYVAMATGFRDMNFRNWKMYRDVPLFLVRSEKRVGHTDGLDILCRTSWLLVAYAQRTRGLLTNVCVVFRFRRNTLFGREQEAAGQLQFNMSCSVRRVVILL